MKKFSIFGLVFAMLASVHAFAQETQDPACPSEIRQNFDKTKADINVYIDRAEESLKRANDKKLIPDERVAEIRLGSAHLEAMKSICDEFLNYIHSLDKATLYQDCRSTYRHIRNDCIIGTLLVPMLNDMANRTE